MRCILSQSKCDYSFTFAELRELCPVTPTRALPWTCLDGLIAETDVPKFLLVATLDYI